MSELKTLLAQKTDILAQIRRIEESCEGIENETNARRISELNEQQMKLSASKHDLQGKLSAIESELNGVSSKIQELSGTGVDKILEAIKNQRWFWFKDKPKVIFDRNTALLWADLNYFEYGGHSLESVNNDLKAINAIGIEGYNTWNVPTHNELWNLVSQKNFPQMEGNNWRIKQQCYYYVYYNGDFYGKDLDDSGATSDIAKRSACLLPCCRSLVPIDYTNNISPSNNFYTEKEKLQFTLNIFVTNDLIPMFQDETITHLYRQIYVEKPALIKQLSDLQTEINKLQEVVLLSSTFDYHALLTGYDIPAIDKSVIKYHEAVTDLAESFLTKLKDYESEKKGTIIEFDAAGLKLGAEYIERTALSDEENETLEVRQNALARHLSLGMDNVKQQILSVKKQGVALARRIAAANCGKDSLGGLARIEQEERPSFSLLAENLAYIVREALKKIEFYEEHRDFALRLIDMWQEWDNSCVDFKTQTKADFRSVCEQNGIPADLGTSVYVDWAEKRLAIEQTFLPLAEYALEGHLLTREGDEPTQAEQALDLLKDYRDNIDGFFREEYVNIHREFGGENFGRREKAELEKAFYWRTAHWLKESLSNLLFAVEEPEEKQFLLRTFQPFLDLPVDAILNYAQAHEELTLSVGLASDLMSLEQQDMRGLLAGRDAYCEGIDERGHSFDSLIERVNEEWANAPAPRSNDNEPEDAEDDGETVTIRKA